MRRAPSLISSLRVPSRMRLSALYPALFLLAAVIGCRTPPAPVAPRSGLPVSASFGKTWDATIDAFADRGIGIETLDRASGLIVPAGHVYVTGDYKRALSFADCGKSRASGPALPGTVKYNVVVRGDSARSTVQVRAFYRTDSGDLCSSKGLYESGVEAAIKSAAEAR